MTIDAKIDTFTYLIKLFIFAFKFFVDNCSLFINRKNAFDFL